MPSLSSDVWWSGECGTTKVGVKVMKVVHKTMNYHSVFAQSSYTWSSSSTPWITSAASAALYPSRVADTDPCTSC